MVDESRDGIEQISEVLQGHSDLGAIHLVSHGAAGKVSLGNTWLSDLNIDAYAGKIAGWNSSLRDGADLLIYGCDLAGDEVGQAFTESLAALTGADVAASIDATGSALLGGDWDPEHQVGDVETAVVFSTQLRPNWSYVLPTRVSRWEFEDAIGQGAADSICST